MVTFRFDYCNVACVGLPLKAILKLYANSTILSLVGLTRKALFVMLLFKNWACRTGFCKLGWLKVERLFLILMEPKCPWHVAVKQFQSRVTPVGCPIRPQ